jgi:hypothetical protein
VRPNGADPNMAIWFPLVWYSVTIPNNACMTANMALIPPLFVNSGSSTDESGLGVTLASQGTITKSNPCGTLGAP